MIRAMGPVRSRRLMISTVLALLVLTPATAISGAAGFVLLAYLPGRLLLSTFGLERFGGQAGRLLFSVSLSWAVMPFLLNPVWYKTNNGLVLLGFTWAAMVCLAWIKGGTDEATLEPDDVRPLFESAAARLSAGLVAAIVVPSVILPFWPTELLGYPIPSQIHDFIKHHAVMDSLERRSLPLGNVFYAAGSAEPVYYYHFFYLIPGACAIFS